MVHWKLAVGGEQWSPVRWKVFGRSSFQIHHLKSLKSLNGLVGLAWDGLGVPADRGDGGQSLKVDECLSY